MDYSQGHVHSVLNSQPEEIELYDRIMQEWLVSTNMEVDEVQAEAEAEDPLEESEVPQTEDEKPLTEDEEPPTEAEEPQAKAQVEAEDPQPEDEEPQPQTTAYGDAHESEAGPSTTPLEKLASKVKKLEANIGIVLVNQSYIIHLLNNLQ